MGQALGGEHQLRIEQPRSRVIDDGGEGRTHGRGEAQPRVRAAIEMQQLAEAPRAARDGTWQPSIIAWLGKLRMRTTAMNRVCVGAAFLGVLVLTVTVCRVRGAAGLSEELADAARAGDLAAVRALLDAGGNPNSRSTLPLHVL
jgi:hypothetical protein